LVLGKPKKGDRTHHRSAIALFYSVNSIRNYLSAAAGGALIVDTLQPTGAWSVPSKTKVALLGPQVARTVPELLLEGELPPPVGAALGSDGAVGAALGSDGAEGELPPPVGAALGSDGAVGEPPVGAALSDGAEGEPPAGVLGVPKGEEGELPPPVGALGSA
jgi:hypothetical protein